MRTVIERIKAISDQGEQYQLVHYQNWVDHLDPAGHSQVIKASAEWQTSTGGHVEPRDDGFFELIQTGELLRRG